MAKKAAKDIDLEDKKVLVRVGFNIPLKDDVITDDTRVKAALPIINYVLERGEKVILFSHLGRVKTEEDKEGKSLTPVAKRPSELLGKEVTFVPEARGGQLEEAIHNIRNGDIVVSESTRFENVDGKKESRNDTELGKYRTSLGDVFVDDVFGTAHRTHTSNVGIASTSIPTVAGSLMEKEIKLIGEAVEEPKRPMIAILGSAKVSDKISAIENLTPRTDKVLIGGGMAYTFYGAKGVKVGNSLVEVNKVKLAKELIEKASDKLALPIDNVCAPEFSNDVETQVAKGDIPDGLMALDIGPASVKLFADTLQGTKTVVWNGPMSVFEVSNFAEDITGVCKAIANLEGATIITGRGDSTATAEQLGFADKFTHISTGGSTNLELLKGKKLPGLAAINDR